MGCDRRDDRQQTESQYFINGKESEAVPATAPLSSSVVGVHFVIVMVMLSLLLLLLCKYGRARFERQITNLHVDAKTANSFVHHCIESHCN